ncbi:MAG: hypothetical protein ACI8QS_001481 [Planctomycetota bacterium]|jgi:hypothetical protein
MNANRPQTRRLSSYLQLACAFFCSVSCASDVDGTQDSDPETGAPRSDLLAASLGAINASSEGYHPLYITYGFSQGLSWGAELDPKDPRKVSLREVYANDEVSGGYDRLTYEFASDLAVLSCSPIAKGNFLLVGSSAADELVIQEWWITPAEEPGGPGVPQTARHSERYRGPLINDVRSIAADPDRPGAMLLAGFPTTLYWIDFRGGPPIGLYDAMTLPHLSNSTFLYRERHISSGLVWVASGNYDGTQIAFTDTASDGSIDKAEELSHAAWDAKGWDGDVWTDNFVDDYPE